MGWLFDPTMQWTLRLLLAGMWILAAAGKFANRDAFYGILHNYRLLPERIERPVADTLPVVELLLAIGLLLLPARPWPAIASALMLLLFAAAMGVNILRGRTEIDCGCFIGTLRQRIGWSLVLRNLLLAGAALLLVGEARTRPLLWLDLVTIAGASAGLLLAYLAISRTLELAPLTEPGR